MLLQLLCPQGGYKHLPVLPLFPQKLGENWISWAQLGNTLQNPARGWTSAPQPHTALSPLCLCHTSGSPGPHQLLGGSVPNISYGVPLIRCPQGWCPAQDHSATAQAACTVLSIQRLKPQPLSEHPPRRGHSLQLIRAWFMLTTLPTLNYKWPLACVHTNTRVRAEIL